MIICIILLSIPGLVIGPYAIVNAGGGQNTLVQGAAIHGCNGIYFDAEDKLYIGSVWGNSITIIDPQTGDILDTLGPDDGVYSPDDVFIAPDGSIYWTSIITGYVGRIEPDGTLTTQFVSQGVNPITMNEEGRLFTALDFLGDGFYELDPELVEDPILLHGPMGYLNGFDFGPDGYLYGPLILEGEIVRVDVDTNPAMVETIISGLEFPCAVKFDSQGRLYFADQMTAEITRVDLDTMEMEVVAQVTQGLDNLAFDSQDDLYVSHAHDGTVWQVLPSDESRTVMEGGLIFPGGVAAMMNGDQERIFVADLWTMRVFEGGTGDLLKIERHIETGATLSGAVTVTPDGDELIATTWLSNNVYTFDPDTSHVIDSYIDLSWRPMDAIRFMGDIVFTELMSGSIKKVDNTSIASGFYVPTGLAVIGDDLYVADWASGMVWQVFDNGNPTMVPVATGLAQPEGLTDDIDGSLLVVEA
jgi:DNA-binding beta-propeller fold protein YncE